MYTLMDMYKGISARDAVVKFFNTIGYDINDKMDKLNHELEKLQDDIDYDTKHIKSSYYQLNYWNAFYGDEWDELEGDYNGIKSREKKLEQKKQYLAEAIDAVKQLERMC